jgi:hypothetical protein
MRQTTSLRLLALSLAVASSVGAVAVAGAQSVSDHVPAAATFSPALDRARADVEAKASDAKPSDAVRATERAPVAGPRSVLLDRRASGLTRVSNEDAKRDLPLPRQENGHTRTNTAMMIVGAAAVVLGAAVGDEAGTVLIIGGAGIGLFGLYRMLN